MGSGFALRYELLQRLLQSLNGILREHSVLVAEQIIGVNLGAEHELNTRQVARTEIKLLVQLAAERYGNIAARNRF